MKISDVSKEIVEIFQDTDKQDSIKYLDTSSITDNIINNFLEFDINIDELPSRAKKKVNHKDIIYSCVRPRNKHYGILSKPPSNLLVSTAFSVIRVDEKKANPNYIYEYITQKKFTDHFHNLGEDSQSSYPAINTDDIMSLNIELPSRSTQDIIGNLSELIKNKIQINLNLNTQLNNFVKKLFYSWFINFEPVYSKLESKRLNFSPEGINLFSSKFVKTELGDIPYGWEISTLGKKIDVISGYAFKSKDYKKDGIFVLRTKNFNDSLIQRLKDDVFLSEKFLDSHKKFICEEFDYHLIMVGASVGNRAMIFPHSLPALRNQNMWCFRPKKGTEISKFYNKFVVDFVTNKLQGYATGSARDFFTKDDFREFKLVIPPRKILRLFSEITDPMLEFISNNFYQINLLSNLKDYYFPQLILGKMKIKDIKTILDKIENVN